MAGCKSDGDEGLGRMDRLSEEVGGEGEGADIFEHLNPKQCICFRMRAMCVACYWPALL